jgi:preprotein translocase subunit SecD
MKLAAAALALALPGAAAADDVLRFVLGDEVVAVSPPDVIARPDNATGPGALHLQLAPFWAAELSELTADHIGETLVIELCGVKVMEPVIRDRITGGGVMVTGDWTEPQLRTLAQRITRGDCDDIRPLVTP